MNWRELLLGPYYFYHKYLIKKSKKWSREEVLQYNEKKLEKFKDFPVSEKADYIKNPQNKLNFLSKRVTTGGTTGTPFGFRRDIFASRQKERAYIFDIWKSGGYKPFNLRVVFRGNTSDNGKLVSYNLLDNCYIIDPRYLNDSTKNELYTKLRSLPSFFLHVYPSSLFTLIQFLGEENFKKLNIQGVLAGSESFPKEQIKSFQSKFNIPVAHWYGHSEYAVLAKYCIGSESFCFYPTYGAIEFTPTSTSNVYSIIATSFNKIGTKFIRYNTQDYCEKNNMNKKANNFISVDAILGRSQDYFYDKNGNENAFGPYLFGLHGEFWDCFEEIQFVQNTKGKLTVLIKNKKNDQVYSILNERFSNRLDLEFETVQEIAKTTMGKHRYFVQNL